MSNKTTEQPKKEYLEWVELTEENRDEIIVGLDRNQEYGTVTQSDEKRFMTGADIQCLSRSIFKRLLLPAKQEVMISDEMIEEVIKFYKYQTLREHDVANCIANDITRLFRVAEFNRSQLLPKPATGEEAIASTAFLNGLLKRILNGEREIIDGVFRNQIINKSHIVKIFEDLAIYEEKPKF